MRYTAPSTTAEAVNLLASNPDGARILAGGTDLLVQLRAGIIAPELLIDIKHINGLRDIVAEDGGLRIGAAVSGAELGEHEAARALWPGVVEAAELIGSTQVQGRCTIVGNLCNASPAADSVPAMVAAGAIARVIGPNGSRDCAVGEIPVAPGRNSLAPGEFITSILLPARVEHASDAYLRFIPRTEMDIAVCSAGVSLKLDKSGICVAARVALGAVAPTVLLVEEAADALIGTTLDEAALADLANACAQASAPIDDKRGTVEFRTEVVGVLAKRAALIAKARALGETS
ncbi:MAG: xanthine dehydrogenase family protein subunit M [Alphaproteobacteria bacterium]|nr:xanthine dehydrogenase family protein subunit M [Alphaproteobacteria bacterium]